MVNVFKNICNETSLSEKSLNLRLPQWREKWLNPLTGKNLHEENEFFAGDVLQHLLALLQQELLRVFVQTTVLGSSQLLDLARKEFDRLLANEVLA